MKQEVTENKIPLNQLKAFYQEVGKTISEWFSSLECPKCKQESDLDWVFKWASNDKPQFVCRNCSKRYYIKGLRFKKQTVEPIQEELTSKGTFLRLPNKIEE